MKHLFPCPSVPSVVAALAGLVLVACANTTTTVVRKTQHGLALSSGKDVSIGYLRYKDPTTDTELVLSNYSSQANVDAIRAQGEREKMLMGGFGEGVATGLRIYGASQGIPLPSGAAPPSTPDDVSALPRGGNVTGGAGGQSAPSTEPLIPSP